MNYSTTTARKILELGTGFLDGRRIHAIESQIKVAEDSAKALDLATLNTMVENRVDAAKLGRQPAKFDLSDIQLYLPDDKAIALRDKVNAQIDTYNLANQYVTDISSWSGPEQLKFVEELRDKAGKDESTATRDADVLRFVEQRVDSNIRWFQRDPAGYMIANNPAIKGIDDQIKSLSKVQGNEEAIQQKRVERDELMLRLQSAPNASDPGKRQHHVVNRAQIKVMSDAEAQATVRAINESSPQEALDVIVSELAKHPGREAIAFNNLVQLQEGQGIKGDYWLVYKNWKNPAVGDLVGALQHAKEAKELAADKMADFDKALDNYINWRIFAQTFPSDNHQMEGMLGGMRSGIISYALLQAQTQKLSPELAIQKSVDTWIYSEMAPTVINGQSVFLDRDRQGLPKLSDTEALEIGRNLSLAIKYIDVNEISTVDERGREHFPVLRSIGNEATRREQLQEILLTRGFFKPGADGSTATFYLRNDTGTLFEVRDKNNRAFQININDIPNLQQRVSTFMNPGGIDVTPRTIVYDKPLVEFLGYETTRTVYGASYTPIYQTNWPVAPKWLNKVERK